MGGGAAWGLLAMHGLGAAECTALALSGVVRCAWRRGAPRRAALPRRRGACGAADPAALRRRPNGRRLGTGLALTPGVLLGFLGAAAAYTWRLRRDLLGLRSQLMFQAPPGPSAQPASSRLLAFLLPSCVPRPPSESEPMRHTGCTPPAAPLEASMAASVWHASDGMSTVAARRGTAQPAARRRASPTGSCPTTRAAAARARATPTGSACAAPRIACAAGWV